MAMGAPSKVLDLVDRFGRNLDTYKRSSYKEAQVRVEFIDPLFEALGWDVRNEQGFAEPYKDVVHEESLRIGGKAKAPDYCFRIGGSRKFFLEAKKPSVPVKQDLGPAYQLRRYAWSAGLPLSILTDFEEMALYDCRIRPKPGDGAHVGRWQYWTFDEYPNRWQEIHTVLAKDSVLKGSFDEWVQETKTKRGTGEVDSEFLKEIEGWRDALARNMALRNPSLSVYELNFAVQRTIDRILFLRMAEDRGIETYGKLGGICDQQGIYGSLVDIYLKADEKYNSGLFDFKADALTPKLILDDKVLKPILTGLYYPLCPYEFSVLPTEVLGRVYEQFLGKVIRLTSGHRAKVEEKPEVKKAGGVYYTPAYIVDYIVKQTVGRLIDGKSPKQIENLKVLDPACGSGSFLLGAYQFLLDHHLKWYESHTPEKLSRRKRPPVCRGPSGEWRLTTAEKKRILLNNIHGVDIDRQAVEVTKLSLLLKVLEGENRETLGRQMSLWQERALPDLDRNIKCGNALIGPEYFKSVLGSDEEELRRVNAFDWQAEFPEIMGRGGFDAVIGNPPYIRIQTMKEWAPTEVEFYKHGYASASKGNYDIYVVFVERALQLLNDDGLMGYILPHKFFQAKYGQALRALLSKGRHLSEVVHFGDQQVFKGASTYTCLLFLERGGKEKFRFVKAHDLKEWQSSGKAVEGQVKAGKATAAEWNFVVGAGGALFERLSAMPVKLGDVARIFVGLQTDADAVFILEEVEQKGDLVLCRSKSTGQTHNLENNHLKHFVKGSLNIRRYRFSDLTKRLIFPYETTKGKSLLIPPSDYKLHFPCTWKYLNENKDQLIARGQGRLDRESWYGYVYKKNHTRLDSSKILVPSLAQGACFAVDLKGQFYFVGSGGGGGGAYGISFAQQNPSAYYWLGLLNSKLSSYFLHVISTPFRGGYIALNRQYIEQLPIRPIDFTDPIDGRLHDELAGLVETMLDLHRKLAVATIPDERRLHERRIEATDRRIDALVYELYGLSDKEIRIVESDE